MVIDFYTTFYPAPSFSSFIITRQQSIVEIWVAFFHPNFSPPLIAGCLGTCVPLLVPLLQNLKADHRHILKTPSNQIRVSKARRIRHVGSEATCRIRSQKSHIISCLGTYVPSLCNHPDESRADLTPLLKLMLFWHQIFIAAAESLCPQGFSSFFENLNFLVLAMPG